MIARIAPLTLCRKAVLTAVVAACCFFFLGGGPASAQEDPESTTTSAPDGGASTSAPPTSEGEGAEEDEETATVAGTLLNQKSAGEREPAEGVSITVSLDGEEIETVTSDEEGKWSVEVPGRGRYDVTIDPETLPDDVALRNEDETTRTANVTAVGQTRTVVFPLGDDPRQTTGGLDRVAQLVFDGVRFGLILAMAAVGLSLIFGTTGLTNFAHGELVTGGALIAWYLNVLVGLPLFASAIVAMGLTGLVGAGLELGLWRPLRKRRTRPFRQYNLQIQDSYGPIGATPKELWSMAIATVVLVAVAVLLQRTRMGKAMRAVADNPDLSSASGIDVDRIILLVWVFGSALACLGGVLVGLAEQVSWEMGARLLLLMFAGITLGGLGTAYGALLGCFLIGLLSSLSTLFIDTSLRTVPALLLLAVILLVRPQGILGRRERIG